MCAVGFESWSIQHRFTVAGAADCQPGGVALGVHGMRVISKNDKHKKYARFAAHSLEMVSAATDPDSRAIQREMAAEWLKLAETVLRPLEPMTSSAEVAKKRV
jgi:hypothetical protein